MSAADFPMCGQPTANALAFAKLAEPVNPRTAQIMAADNVCIFTTELPSLIRMRHIVDMDCCRTDEHVRAAL